MGSSNTKIDANQVVEVAAKIANHDFRVTVQYYVPRGAWVITVGESRWQRHLVVEQITSTDATLLVLSRAQAENFGYDIDVKDVERRTTLNELTARDYTGVRDALQPCSLAA